MQKFFVFYKKFGVLMFLVIICAVFTALNPVFFSLTNLVNIAKQVSIMSVMCVGMTFVLLTGGIDLSMGSLISLVCVLTSKLVCEMGFTIVPAYLIAVLLGMIVGLINGVLIAKFKVPALIITLGMSTSLAGISYTICNGIPIYSLPAALKVIGQHNVYNILPLPVIIMIVFLFAGWFLLNKTYIGRYFYAIGSNEEATELAGINADNIRILAYFLSGFVVSIGGLIMLGRIGSGQPNAGIGYEMDVLTGCVLGGVSLTGGKGKIWNAFLGILIIGGLSTGLTLAGTSEFTKQIVKGVVLIVAVVFDCAQYIKVKKKITIKDTDID